MANIKDGRKLISVTMLPELYTRICTHCAQNDIPVSVWVRNLVAAELDRLGK